MTKKPKVIRNYKDTVFRMLYKDKKELLELYNGLNGTAYTNPEDLEVYTLENAIYMNVKNDVSFLFHSELNLFEQQASYNPNMALRFLIYITRQYEKYIRNKSLYSSRQVKIPAPRFVVFYNGTDKRPEMETGRLSDAFEKAADKPELELKVRMLNINSGNNKELLDKCRTLKEYCMYVERIRNYVKKMPVQEAVEHAVNECIRENILSDFLLANKAEVIAMSIFEYDEEQEMKKIRKDEYELGKENGIEEGQIRGAVETCQEFGKSKEETRDYIQKKFSLSEERVAGYVNQYWKSNNFFEKGD